MPGLEEDNWIFTPASAFTPLQTVVLVEAREENLNLIMYVVGKGTSISLVFLDNCEYGFFKKIPTHISIEVVF